VLLDLTIRDIISWYSLEGMKLEMIGPKRSGKIGVAKTAQIVTHCGQEQNFMASLSVNGLEEISAAITTVKMIAA
jgi:hypothetical protein